MLAVPDLHLKSVPLHKLNSISRCPFLQHVQRVGSIGLFESGKSSEHQIITYQQKINNIQMDDAVVTQV